jgi:hypothetical protein
MVEQPRGIDTPEFTTHQMLACAPGLAAETYNQWLNRGVVILREEAAPGRGRRRLYSPRDVVQIATIWEMVRQGFPPSKARQIWLVTESRLITRTSPAPGEAFDAVLLFCMNPQTGELVLRFDHEGGIASRAEGEDEGDETDVPDVFTLVRVDRFVARVLARMDAIRQQAARPREPDPVAGDDPDPMRAYDQDSAGRRVLVGLTLAETSEYLTLLAPRARPYASEEEFEAAHERYEELNRRHAEARFRRLAAEAGANHHA